jgi:hypothetical protein
MQIQITVFHALGAFIDILVTIGLYAMFSPKKANFEKCGLRYSEVPFA